MPKVDEDPEFCPYSFDCHWKPDCLVYSGASEKTAELVVKEVSMKGMSV